MDLSYFESAIPVIGDILNIIIASGWALLLGNLVFQAAKSMMSGLGFEGEDSKTLFARTFVFGFLLLASRQVCDIGLGISNAVVTILEAPDSVSISIPGETVFSIGASWLLVIIVGFVLMWQIVGLFFEVGERYFLVGFLTIMSPWAFAMGGSKSTADVFKGWARMFASMCVMMVMNVVFLKILLSAMGNMPSDAGVLPWLIFVVAIARVARKIDSVISRIGLNPALTGDGLGRGGLPGMLSYMVIKSLTSGAIKAAGGAAGRAKTPPNKPPSPSGTSPAGTRAGAAGRNNAGNRGAAQNMSSTHNTSNSSTSQQAGAGSTKVGFSASPTSPGAAGIAVNSTANQSAPSGSQFHTAGREQTASPRNNSVRQSAVTNPGSARSPVFRSGAAGTPVGSSPQTGKSASPGHPPIPRAGQAGQIPAADVPQTAPQGGSQAERPSRYSAVPSSTRNSPERSGAANAAGSTRIQQGGANVSAQNKTSISANQSSSNHESNSMSNRGSDTQPKQASPSGARSSAGPGTLGAAGIESRKSSVSANKPQGVAGTESHKSSASSAYQESRAPAQTTRDSGRRVAADNSRLRAGEAERVEAICSRLNEEAETARRYLDLCGLEVLDPEYTDNAVLELLYETINKNTARRVKLPDGVFDMMTVVHGVYGG